MKIAGLICSCNAVTRNRTKWRVHVIDYSGVVYKIWSYQDRTALISPKQVYEIDIDCKSFEKSGYTIEYLVMASCKEIGSYSNSDKASTAIAEQKIFELSGNKGTCFRDDIWKKFETQFFNYRNSEEVKKAEENQYVFDRIGAITEDLIQTQGQQYGQWLSTYQPQNKKFDDHEHDQDIWQVIDKHRPMYGVKSKYLYVKKPVLNTATKSRAGDVGLDFEEFGIRVWVDSIHCMVAFRERHVWEWYMYWLLVGYAKKSRRYPRIKLGSVLPFLKKYVIKYRRGNIVQTLMKMHEIKMIELDKNLYKKMKLSYKNLGLKDFKKELQEFTNTYINILSQKKYVRKQEAAYNAKSAKSRKIKRIWKKNPRWKKQGVLCEDHPKRDKNYSEWVGIGPVDDSGNEIPPICEGSDIHRVWRPYFDIHFPRTAELDIGFVQLINSTLTNMRAYMYELIVSSVDNYPICRTRWRTNLLLSRSAQIHYEKINPNLEKHYNHMEITADMQDRIKPYVLKDMIETGKFKATANGRLLRQEGNSYRSKRVKWTNPKKARQCRLYLSQNQLRAWKYGRPWYEKSESGDLINPRYRQVPDVVVEKTQPAVYTSIKKGSEKAFAYIRNGVIVPSTRKRNWREFEPMIEYDGLTGEGIVPSFPSFDSRDFENRTWHRQVSSSKKSVVNIKNDIGFTSHFF